jgi:hypothetical protein
LPLSPFLAPPPFPPHAPFFSVKHKNVRLWGGDNPAWVEMGGGRTGQTRAKK